MEIKLFEVRRSGLALPYIAIRVYSGDAPSFQEAVLLEQAGLTVDGRVLLGPLCGGRFMVNPLDSELAVMQRIHRFIEENWSNLTSGDVINPNDIP